MLTDSLSRTNLPYAPDAGAAEPAAVKLFTLFPRPKTGDVAIRLYYKRTGGVGPKKIPHVSFYTGLTLGAQRDWDTERNRVKRTVAGAAELNAKLDAIATTVLEAVEAGMTQDEVRELLGHGPVQPHKPYKTKATAGEVTEHQAKAVLVKKGWKAGRRAPGDNVAPENVQADQAGPENVAPDNVGVRIVGAPDNVRPENVAPHNVQPDNVRPDNVAPAPAPAHDPETAAVLRRYGRDPLAGAFAAPPAAAPAAPAKAPEPVGFLLVLDAESGEPQGAGTLDKGEAVRRAGALAAEHQRPFLVVRCQPVARVQVRVDEL